MKKTDRCGNDAISQAVALIDEALLDETSRMLFVIDQPEALEGWLIPPLEHWA
jgi:hypothetical protein